MPTMANITVKAANGTTDVVYTALSASAGDTVPAQWRNEAIAVAPGLRPTVAMVTKSNGPRTARVITSSFVYPEVVTDSVTGTSRVRNRIPISVTATIPLEVPSTVSDEAVAQAFNLFNSALFIACNKGGYGPT